MAKEFSMDDYVDVAERIRLFYERFPEGRLQTVYAQGIELGERHYISVKAYAYRSPDDTIPGAGHAWEPVPGATSFTKDSELQNAETAAWGRAIVSLGFETKHIASQQEVRNRQPEQQTRRFDWSAFLADCRDKGVAADDLKAILQVAPTYNSVCEWMDETGQSQDNLISHAADRKVSA